MNTLAQLRTSIVRQVFSDLQPENLVDSHKQIILEALSEIQKFVPCEKSRNANVIKFCNTWYKCGVTIVPRPKGVIRFLYTIDAGDWCAPTFYTQVGREEFECAARGLLPTADSEDASVPVMPLGFKRADASTDAVCGRAMRGIWCIDGDNILISPWIQSTESVVIEWTGAKSASQWTDEDPVSDAIDFRKAVKLYLQYGHERDYGDMAVALTYHNPSKSGTYDEALSDLMLECQEQTRVRADESCKLPCWCTASGDTLRALEDGVFRALE
jgi:hypothetical protein